MAAMKLANGAKRIKSEADFLFPSLIHASKASKMIVTASLTITDGIVPVSSDSVRFENYRHICLKKAPMSWVIMTFSYG